MNNKPMLSVDRELLERITRPQLKRRDETVRRRAITELRALLDKEVDWDSHAPKHQGEPVAEVEREFDNSPAHVHLYQDLPDGTKLYAEQPAPVADHTQCEECKGWGYHENHHEGGGTECGECGGSGNATVAVVPDVDELAQIIRKVDGSNTLGSGSLAEAIIEEVSRLNRVKP